MTQLNQTSVQAKHFDRGYRILHWVMAVLIFLMFFALQGFANVSTEEEHLTMLIGHSSMGTIISMLILTRIFKRFIKRDPVPEQPISALQRRAATSVQYALYALMVWVPVSGYLTARFHELPVMAFGAININAGHNAELFELLRTLHAGGIRLLMLLLLLHIGAALFHVAVKRDGVMRSMLRGR